MPTIDVARLATPGEALQVGTAEKPAPGPDDVLVRVAACGLVPNSFNVVNVRTPFTLPTLPAIFGLDVSGTIEAVGAHVLNLEVGQRVYVNPHLTSGTCHQCRRDRRDQCPYGCLRGYMSTSPLGSHLIDQYPVGGLSEYVIAADTAIVPLPDSIDLHTAARFGYLGTSYAGLATAGVGPARTVLVNGVTGTLGVAAVAIALGLGATTILGIGRNPERLEQVAQLDPRRVVTVSSETCQDLPGWVREQTDGLGVHALFDCLGVGGDADITSRLLDSVRSGGIAALAAGGAEGDLSQTYAEAMSRNVAVVGSGWATRAQFADMTDLIGAGVIDLSFLQHRTFTLDDVNDAFTFVGGRPGGFTNVVVEPGTRN